MRLAILGPMGVAEVKLRSLAADILAPPVSVDIHDSVEPTPEAMIPLIKDADALIFATLPLPEKVVAACPKLKLACAAFTGLDRVDIAACHKLDIEVCSAPGYSTEAVAEFTLGLMLAVLRKFSAAFTAARSGGTFRGLQGAELAGRTVGLVGTGAIGLEVARLLAPFGCRLLGYDRNQKPEAEDLGITFVDLEALLAQSDVVSLHLPLVPETENLIDERRLGLMKSDAILINTARGALVDNTALARALEEGKVAGAGLDTVDVRPPVPADHPLLKAPTVTLTPHMAFATREAFYRRAQLVLENVAAWQLGKPQNLQYPAPETSTNKRKKA